MLKNKTTRILLAVLAVVIVAALLAGLFVMMAGMTLFSSAAEQKRRQDASLMTACLAPMVSADGKYANPIVGPITSDFGPRPNPFGPGVLPPGYTSEERLMFHYGVDIGGMATGTPFYAAASGVVEGAEIGGHDGGNIIRIRDDQGNVWIYVHAADGTTVVKKGQRVEAGDRLAGAGETGAARGVHLHLELRTGPEEKSVDPVPFLAARGVTVGQGGPAPVGEGSSARASSSVSAPVGTSASASSPPLPGPGEALRVPLPNGTSLPLLPEQQRNAAIIIGVGRELNLSDQAIVIALMTAFQESSLFNLASPAVPESLNYPHDRTGVNKQSVGLFQQQHTMGWGTVEGLMNPEISTRTFFYGLDSPGGARGLLDYPGWESMAPGEAAQMVQTSRHPFEYIKWEETARFLLANIAGASVAQCQSGPSQGDGSTAKEVMDQREASGEGTDTVVIPAGVSREQIVAAARSGVGGKFVWGGSEFKAWDASGLVAWVYRDQGVQVPRTSPWTVAKRTESPQPGDLVAQKWDSRRQKWEHVGIYVGNGRMVSVINEQTGTREHPVVQTGDDPVYFDILGGQ